MQEYEQSRGLTFQVRRPNGTTYDAGSSYEAPGFRPLTAENIPGLQGGLSGISPAMERFAGPHEYSFTSLAGLAEKMQQAAAGQGGEVDQQQLAVLQQIRDKLPDEGSRIPHSPPQGLIAGAN